MSKRKNPVGFVARCQCGVITGAMDYERTDRKEAGQLLGRWLAEGCTVEPRFGNFSETVYSCHCDSPPCVHAADCERDHCAKGPNPNCDGYRRSDA
jgi:hypothetical protein